MQRQHVALRTRSASHHRQILTSFYPHTSNISGWVVPCFFGRVHCPRTQLRHEKYGRPIAPVVGLFDYSCRCTAAAALQYGHVPFVRSPCSGQHMPQNLQMLRCAAGCRAAVRLQSGAARRSQHVAAVAATLSHQTCCTAAAASHLPTIYMTWIDTFMYSCCGLRSCNAGLELLSVAAVAAALPWLLASGLTEGNDTSVRCMPQLPAASSHRGL